MKRFMLFSTRPSILKIPSLVFCLCLLFFGAGVFAQKNSSEWPDAVKAAPKNHRVLYEDDDFRILLVTVNPGEKENVHGHRWNSILIAYQSGKFIDHVQGGPDLKAPAPSPNEPFPMVMMKGPEAPHSVENVDSVTDRLIRVEFKKAPFTNVPPAPGILTTQRLQAKSQ